MGRGWNYGPTYLICTPSDQYILSGSNELAPRDYFFYYLEGRRNAVIMNKTVLTISLLILGGFLWATGSTVPPVDYRISAEEAKTLVASGAVLLDVRTEGEYNSSHISGAVLLPYDEITATSAAKAIETLDTPVVVYCRSGRRSSIAVKTLVSLGYTAVRDLGAITNWSDR